MKSARSLTNTTICQLPKSRIARALKKTKDSSKPSIAGFVAWRNTQLSSTASGTTINDTNANNVITERQSLVVNDWPLASTLSLTPSPSGIIDKTRWFPLGPNNVSGRIITMLIDPDHPDTLWAGSAGGGLWKSVNNGDNWNPIADFPGNTAVSAIKMDPYNHDTMYIGTWDKDLNWVPGNGIFKSTDRGTTWTHVTSTSSSQDPTWKTIKEIYPDPTTVGRFIVASSVWNGSWVLVSDDNMQTWHPIISWEHMLWDTLAVNPYTNWHLLIADSGISPKKIFVSNDYGYTFSGVLAPADGRSEFAFAKPNAILIARGNGSDNNQPITLTNNTASGDTIMIDTVWVNLTTRIDATVSWEICIRQLGSTDNCANNASKQTIHEGSGTYLFSWTSLGNPILFSNSGGMDFEIYVDTPFQIVSSEIQIDRIGYTKNNIQYVDTYIWGESFWNGLIYASVDENNGTLYRSIDLGNSWELVSSGASLLGNQWWYWNTIWVNPFDQRHIIVWWIDLFESRDGGYTWRRISNWAEQMYNWEVTPHSDHHSIIMDPRFDNIWNRRIYIGTDGGIYRTDDVDSVVDALSWWHFAGNGLNITQFYSISGTGNIVQWWAQDNGTTLYQWWVNKKWSLWNGGDGEDTVVDPRGRYIYGECQNGACLSRGKIENGTVTPESIERFTEINSEFRTWEAPILLDPNNPSRLFYGANSLWVAENADTANASDVIFRKFGNPNTLLGWSNSPITDIAIASQNSNRIWIAKSNDLYYTMSGTTTSGEVNNWTKITASNLPWRNITHIEVDYYDPNKVYITYGGYEWSNVWMTTNNGVSWVDISANLPNAPTYTIKQYRNNPNFLYVGTEVWLFYSENGGQSWSTTNEWPANTPVFDIEWYDSNTMLIATFGRWAWALDLNNLTVVTPPTTAIVSGEVVSTSSGILNISHYKNPLQVEAKGNQTIFYTTDGSVPTSTSSGTVQWGIFTLSGKTLMSPTGQVQSFSWDTLTLKVRSRDFANNWSDVNTYLYHYKDSIESPHQLTWGSGATTLTMAGSDDIESKSQVTESGSAMTITLVGSILLSGSIVPATTIGYNGSSISATGTVDAYWNIVLRNIDTQNIPDGIVYTSWQLSDRLGNIGLINTGTLLKNIVSTHLLVDTGSLIQSGVISQSGIIYSKVKTVLMDITTDELSHITATGTAVGFPTSFWNTNISGTGKYQSTITATLTGSEWVRNYTVSAIDMSNIYWETLTGKIIYDITPPAITPINYSSGMIQSNGYFTLKWVIEDLSPSQLRINNIPVVITGNTWSIDILVQVGMNHYEYTSSDILWNMTTGYYSITGQQFVGPGGWWGTNQLQTTWSSLLENKSIIPTKIVPSLPVSLKVNSWSLLSAKQFRDYVNTILTLVESGNIERSTQLEKLSTILYEVQDKKNNSKKTIIHYKNYIVLEQKILQSYINTIRKN
jgi:hypothetical protein